MPKTLVCLDCDGPLANFVDGFLTVIEEETGARFGESVVTEWEITESPFFLKLAEDVGRDPKELSAAVWKRANRIGFCSSLFPVWGAREAVEQLRSLDVDVEVVTSPLISSPTWMPERFEWLRQHFGFKKDQIHFVAKKQRVPGDFLIDDKPQHVGAWSNAAGDTRNFHGRGLLWNAPYNATYEDCGTRVRSWPEVVTIVSGFQASKLSGHVDF